MMKTINAFILSTMNKLSVIMMCYGANMLYLFVFAVFLNYITGYSLTNIIDLYKEGYQLFEEPSPKFVMFMGLVSAPLWEELAFRWFPVKVAEWAKDTRMLIPIIVLSSIIFGYGHGGPIHIWIQGVGGLFLSLCYIKTGKSYLSSVFLHFLINLTLMYLLPLFH